MLTERCKVSFDNSENSAGFEMLRFVTLLSVLALASAENIFRIDLDPEEAAKYINSPPFSHPELSARTNVLPLIKYSDPRFRSAEAGPTLGHYWKNGKEIENTEDYIEEVYDASQFHGQDGLGAYSYGYRAPESAKVENRARSGDVVGFYTYKAPGYGGNDIQVHYWADSQGFHQEDNLPKYVPKQIEEAPEVKAARIAHEKAWNEAAYANLHPGAAAAQAQVQPSLGAYQQQGNYQQGNQLGSYQQGYQAQPSQNNYQQGYQAQPSQNNYQQGYQAQPSTNSYQGYQAQPSQKNYQQGFQAQPSQNSYQQYRSNDYQSQASEQQSSVVPAPGQAREGKSYEQYENQGYTTTTEEPTGPPRGFFYSFNYPVSIIVPKSEASHATNPGHPVDDDTVSQYGRSQ